jgi:hypothetical protein
MNLRIQKLMPLVRELRAAGRRIDDATVEMSGPMGRDPASGTPYDHGILPPDPDPDGRHVVPPLRFRTLTLHREHDPP